ncbi:MAG TPA: efflux RND transporter permease subunit, partial [Candidatus Hypogeohydataceae bacterium YC40]
MIDRLVVFSLYYRFIIITLTVFCIGFGILSLKRLPIEAYPDVTNVQVQIITQYPGRAAEEVEKVITIPIEKVMNALPRLVSLRSISIFSLSVVTVVFEDGTNPYFARQQVTEFMNSATLPGGVQPTLAPLYTPIGEIYRYTLEGPPDISLLDLKATEDWVVEKGLRTVPGVVGVVGFGGPTKQYQVRVIPEKLRAYGITLHETFEALAKANINAGGSLIEHGSEVYTVRGLGLIKTISDIENTVIKAREGVPITVKDIAEVGVGPRVRLGIVGMEERDDVVASVVLLRKGDNPLEVLKRVRAKVDELNETLAPTGVRIVPYYDRTNLIHKTLETIAENLLAGVFLVLMIIIVYLGIHNIRVAFIVASVIPLSLLFTFIMLDLRGVPANLLSLGAIDFGIIVDGAVVVVDNIIRHLNLKKDSMALLDIISYATREVGNPVVFAKLILVVAFIPIFSFQRVEGRIFSPMVYTLCFAFLGSLLFSFTVIPVLCSFFLKPGAAREGFIIHFLRNLYVPVVTKTVSHSWVTVGIAIGLLAGSLAVVPFLGTEFLPELDEGALWVRVTMPPNISLSTAEGLVHEIRSVLQEFPEVVNTASQLGRPDDGTDVNGFDNVEIFVDL